MFLIARVVPTTLYCSSFFPFMGKIVPCLAELSRWIVAISQGKRPIDQATHTQALHLLLQPSTGGSRLWQGREETNRQGLLQQGPLLQPDSAHLERT